MRGSPKPKDLDRLNAWLQITTDVSLEVRSVIDLQRDLQLSRVCSIVVRFNDLWIDQSSAICVPSSRVRNMNELRSYLEQRLRSSNLEVVRSQGVHVLHPDSRAYEALQKLLAKDAVRLMEPQLCGALLSSDSNNNSSSDGPWDNDDGNRWHSKHPKYN